MACLDKEGQWISSIVPKVGTKVLFYLTPGQLHGDRNPTPKWEAAMVVCTSIADEAPIAQHQYYKQTIG